MSGTSGRKSAAGRVTSAGGGMAGKLGERYEAWWTVLHGALPILDGIFRELRVEEPGINAIEFRVIGHRDGDADQAHQCKKIPKGAPGPPRSSTVQEC